MKTYTNPLCSLHSQVCQLKKKPSTRISLTKKVGHESVTNSWNDREFDESSNSNSNSLDDISIDDSTLSGLKDKSKLAIKSEIDVVKNELEETESITATTTATTTMNRRKKNRCLKATIMEEAAQSDDDKSLNMGWTTDEMVKNEKSVSPINHTIDADSNTNTNNNISDDVEIKTEEVDGNKEEKRTRASNVGSHKTHTSDSKPKLTSSHCKYCFKKFSNASNLRRHITMSHFGPKNFTCNLCTFRGRRKSDIVGHMRTKHERTGAPKLAAVNEKPLSKPPSQGSFSRRKDKHTEVLQDDQEEIYIDSESFMLEETIDQFKLSSNSSQENSNIDEIVNTMSEPTTETLADESAQSKQNHSLKRKGRPKSNESIKKMNRSPVLSIDQNECKSIPARRPVRNRIMPVKKDFVYDLSTLLKKDYKDFQDDTQKELLPSQTIHPEPPAPQSQQQSQPLPQPQPVSTPPSHLPIVQEIKSNTVPSMITDNKTPKRRCILPQATDAGENEPQIVQADGAKNETRIQTPPEKTPNQENAPKPNATGIDCIKGAADAMAEQAVKANRAAFYKPPELPTERPPTVPSRCGTMKDWPVLKSPSAIFVNYKSKFPNLKVPGLKRKKRSCLLKNHKNRLHDKHNKIEANGTHANSLYDSTETEQKTQEIPKISSKLVDKIQLQCTQIVIDTTKIVQSNSDASNKLAHSNKQHATVPSASPRRMTLLERLAENKTKKLNESLSRMTIANDNNDSDDD